jgi:pyruvate,water dikinase
LDDTAPTYVVTQQDAATAPLPAVGAKAATLAKLAREGIPVPPFFVVSSEAFALHLQANDIGWPLTEEAPVEPDTAADTTQAAGLRDRIRTAAVPDAVAGQVVDAYEALCRASGRDQVAVRSSASDEDSAWASFAGQFVSILGVDGSAALLDAVRACWASSLSERALRYRAGLATPFPPGEPSPTPGWRGPSFGVVVQSQVDSCKAGVAFTVHPLEPDGDLSYVEANFGTGESVTGGLVNPDGITVSRSTLEVVEARIGSKRRMTTTVPRPAGSTRSPGSLGSPGSPGEGGTVVVDLEESMRRSAVLSDDEVRRVVEIGLRLEELLGCPQDVEWAFDSDRFWVLQSRPVTTLDRTRQKEG